MVPVSEFRCNKQGETTQGPIVNELSVFNVSDPTNTGQFITRYNLPAKPFDVAIGGGIGFVADGPGGLQVVNYQAFDAKGVPPIVTITQLPSDQDPTRPGVQVNEGQIVTL